MNEQLEVLRIICTRLNSEAIPYMVTGSVAASFYGVARMTRDIDIVVELATSDARRIHQLFESDFYTDLEVIESEIGRTGIFNLIHESYALKVDFIVRKSSEYRRLEFERRTIIPVGDFECAVVRLEDLIISKLAWAQSSESEPQIRDVQGLLSIEKRPRHELP